MTFAYTMSACTNDTHSPIPSNPESYNNIATSTPVRVPQSTSSVRIATTSGIFTYAHVASIEQTDGAQGQIAIHAPRLEVAWEKRVVKGLQLISNNGTVRNISTNAAITGNKDITPLIYCDPSVCGGGGGPSVCDPELGYTQGCSNDGEWDQWDNAGCIYNYTNCGYSSPTSGGTSGEVIWTDGQVCYYNFSNGYLWCSMPFLGFKSMAGPNLFVSGSHTIGTFSVTCRGPGVDGYFWMYYKDPHWGFKGWYIGLGGYTKGANNTYSNPGNLYSMFKLMGWSLPPPGPPPNVISFESEWYKYGFAFWQNWEGFCNFSQ